jgi:hypothetical protein
MQDTSSTLQQDEATDEPDPSTWDAAVVQADDKAHESPTSNDESSQQKATDSPDGSHPLSVGRRHATRSGAGCVLTQTTFDQGIKLNEKSNN